MTVQVSISVMFEAEDSDAADKAIKKMKFPDGAIVNVHASQSVVSGVADSAGAVVPHPVPEPPPPPIDAGEPIPE